LEGISEDHLGQPPAQSRFSKTGCSEPHFEYPPRTEIPQPLWNTCSNISSFLE